MNATEWNCTCGHCPEIRKANGLRPFCQLPPPPPRVRPANEFGSYRDAVAACKPGEAVRSKRIPGGPPRFVVLPKGRRW